MIDLNTHDSGQTLDKLNKVLSSIKSKYKLKNAVPGSVILCYSELMEDARIKRKIQRIYDKENQQQEPLDCHSSFLTIASPKLYCYPSTYWLNKYDYVFITSIVYLSHSQNIGMFMFKYDEEKLLKSIDENYLDKSYKSLDIRYKRKRLQDAMEEAKKLLFVLPTTDEDILCYDPCAANVIDRQYVLNDIVLYLEENDFIKEEAQVEGFMYMDAKKERRIKGYILNNDVAINKYKLSMKTRGRYRLDSTFHRLCTSITDYIILFMKDYILLNKDNLGKDDWAMDYEVPVRLSDIEAFYPGGCGKTSFSKAINLLIKDGYITRVKNGWFALNKKKFIVMTGWGSKFEKDNDDMDNETFDSLLSTLNV